MSNDIISNPFSKFLSSGVNNSVIEFATPKMLNKLYTNKTIVGAFIRNKEAPSYIQKFAQYNYDFLSSNQVDNQSIIFEDTKYYSSIKGDSKGKFILNHKNYIKLDPAKALKGNQATGDCFFQGSKVTMADGSEKNIEDVKIGEYVLTPYGNIKRVIDTIKKPYSGKIYHIQVKGSDRIISLTPDHKLMSFPNFSFGRKAKIKKNKYILGETSAENLSVKDRILVPFLNIPEKEVIFDLSKFVRTQEYDDKFIFCVKSKINRYIKLDSNFSRLLGLFIAEGSCSNERIRFSVGTHEQLLIQEINDLIQLIFNITPSIRQVNARKTCTVITVNSTIISNFINSLNYGDNQWNKKIPQCIFTTSRLNKISFVKGWMDGDGHSRLKFSKNGYSYQIQGTSVSKLLRKDIQRLLLSCKIKSNLRTRKKEKHQRASSGDVYLYGYEALKIYPEASTEIKTNKKTINQLSDISKYGIASPISNIKVTEEKDIFVYCLNIEDDHKFICEGLGVFNCVSWAIRSALDQLRCNKLANGAWEAYICRQATCGIYSGRGHTGDGADPVGLSAYAIKIGTLLERIYETSKQKYDFSNYKDYVNWGISRGRSGMPSDLLELTKPYTAGGYKVAASTDGLADLLINGGTAHIGSMLSVESVGNPISRRTREGWAHDMNIVGFDDTDEIRNKFGSRVWIIDNSWGQFNSVTNIPEHWKPFPEGAFSILEKDMQYAVDDGGTVVFYDGQWFKADPITNEVI